MKKLFIIICLLPFAGLAQDKIIVQVPKYPIDSATKLVCFRAVAPVPGAKRDKLFGALSKWSASNFEAVSAYAQAGNDSTKIRRMGISSGTYSLPQPIDNETTVDYKVKFIVEVTVADEKYSIALSNFKVEFFDTSTPLEQFIGPYVPYINKGGGFWALDRGRLYSYILADINLSAPDIIKDAAKYVAKAKKKGTL
jgi:hypothetical protein